MSIVNCFKGLVLFFPLFFSLSVFSQIDDKSINDSIKDVTEINSSSKEKLNPKEKFALNMLKKWYDVKSIALQTNLEKKQIKLIKKKYIK